MKKVKMAFIDGTNYRVTNFGEVVNKFGRPLKGHKVNGYQMHMIRVDNKAVKINTAREVYKAFKGSIPEGCEITHVDGNKANNNIKNLECVTHTCNMSRQITRARLIGPKHLNEIKYERIS